MTKISTWKSLKDFSCLIQNQIDLGMSILSSYKGHSMGWNNLVEYGTIDLVNSFWNNEAYPYIFIRVKKTWFVILAIFVDDLNLIGSPKEITDIFVTLTKEFEIKDIG